MHFVEHDGELLGHFGRHGTLRGSVRGHLVEASWKCRERAGWIRLILDPSRRTLEGEYGVGNAGSPRAGRCRAAAQRK
jgi:hypothetical protein